MFALLLRLAPRRTKSLAMRGLTPNDSRALFSLDRRSGLSMRSLADEWRRDPSNATWIVDRLETLGLAARRPVPHDRRVKLVLLTRKGQRTRTESWLQEFHQPPPEFDLHGADLEALERVLAKMSAPAKPTSSSPPLKCTVPPRQAWSLSEPEQSVGEGVRGRTEPGSGPRSNWIAVFCRHQQTRLPR